MSKKKVEENSVKITVEGAEDSKDAIAAVTLEVARRLGNVIFEIAEEQDLTIPEVLVCLADLLTAMTRVISEEAMIVIERLWNERAARLRQEQKESKKPAPEPESTKKVSKKKVNKRWIN